ncbi:spore germination lipoprotein GerD [Salsuginibacillus kocurii]|uniref:spore germination lipoprotein GerD n=1 Tax=Salsuginibacillus kocurii TaxID=427078 RepID=UPI000381648A|nr:spore germination lipoprotein GerD [Salsuginibacillus kocurii]
MKKQIELLAAVLMLVLLGSCAPEAEGTQAQHMDYEQSKEMMVDLLKSDQAKGALLEVLEEEEFQQALVLNQPVVKDAIEDQLLSEEGKQFWKHAFNDPEFSATMAKSMEEEHEQLLNDLMKEPEYRQRMTEILADQEMSDVFFDMMKTSEYRQLIMDVMAEALEAPHFRLKVQELLLQQADEIAEEGDTEDHEGEEEGDEDEEEEDETEEEEDEPVEFEGDES